MTPETVFKLINELIKAIAWPLVVFTLALIFKKDVKSLLSRLRKGSLFGQQLELDANVEKLKESVQQLEKEVPVSSTQQEQKREEDDVSKILDDATKNSVVAVIRLARLIEQEVLIMVGSVGHLKPGLRMSVMQGVQVLASEGRLPPYTVGTLKIFLDLRNKIVHGGWEPKGNETLQVLEHGIILLRALRAIPHEINVVYKPDVELFSDKDLKSKLDDVVGLLLETTSPGAQLTSKRIFPTTRKSYYQKGKRVTWEWDLSRVWKEAWYLDPDTNEKKPAWSSSGEFVGRHVDEFKS